MGSYEQLPTLLRDLIDTAIESDMLCQGFEGNMKTGFDGYFRPYNNENGDRDQGVTIHVDPQGNATAPDGQDPFDFFMDSWIPSRDCWAHWEQQIHALFTGWDSLPDPKSFDTAVGQLRHGSHLLFEESTLDPGDAQVANTGLSDMGYLQDKLAPMDGDAMRAFHRYYASPLPIVVSGQAGLAHTLYFGLASERQIWADARLDVAEVATRAIEGMRGARPAGDSGIPWASVLKVVTSVGSVVALVVTDGAAAPFLAAGNAALGIVSKYAEDPEADPKPKSPLGGSNPGEVVEHIRQRLQEENDAIFRAEARMTSAVGEATQASYDTPASFNLADAAKAAENAANDHGETAIDTDNASSIASATELRLYYDSLHEIVTSVLPNIAAQLDGARKDIASADQVSLWDRPAGIGYEGSFAVWSELAFHLDAILNDSAWTLNAAADHIEIVVRDFKKTDADVHADLAAHTKRVEEGSGAYTGRPGADSGDRPTRGPI